MEEESSGNSCVKTIFNILIVVHLSFLLPIRKYTILKYWYKLTFNPAIQFESANYRASIGSMEISVSYLCSYKKGGSFGLAFVSALMMTNRRNS